MVKTTFYANMIRSPRPCKKLHMQRGGLGLFLPACTLELPVWHGDFTVVTKGVDREEGNLQVLRNLKQF